MADTPLLNGPSVPPLNGEAATSIVILLHGYGSNGADLIGLVPYWREALPGTLFLAPNAPQVCPGSPGGYQWWAINRADPGARAMGLLDAAPALNAFIDHHRDTHGLSDSKVALVGFSQGTMMALHVGPRRAEPLAGIIGYSGLLADADALSAEVKSRPPVLLVHGDADPVIPMTALATAQTGLERAGLSVQSHLSPRLGHSIDGAGLALGCDFLVSRLS